MLTPVTTSCCLHEINSTSLTYQKPQPQICGFLQKSNPGYSLLNRGIFYAARLISAQLSVEFTNDDSDKEQYDKIKKVYSIWIGMDCPEDKKDSIINYSFEPHIIYQGSDKLKLYKNCDLMNITFIHLSGKPDQSHHRLISMLDTLLAKMDAETKKKKLQEEHNLPMTIKIALQSRTKMRLFYLKILCNRNCIKIKLPYENV